MHERCGKLVLATSDSEASALVELERRGRANGLANLRRLAAGEIREFEPHVRGHAGLWLPDTGIVDFAEVAKALARELWERGAEIRVGARVKRIERHPDRFALPADAGVTACRMPSAECP